MPSGLERSEGSGVSANDNQPATIRTKHKIVKKVAIYARYSSDRQSERSIEDQVRLCRERAEREGWSVVEVFPDFALSGATRD